MNTLPNDSTRNLCAQSTVEVIDCLSVNVPKITNFFVSENNGIIKGKAKGSTTIIVLQGHKLVAEVSVTYRGTFVVKVPKPEKGKWEFVLYAIDKEGNQSESVKRTINLK